MKKEIAEKWIGELRSGKWKQGKCVLNNGGEYCCLGVLCEIALTENICEANKEDGRPGVINYDKNTATLPESVIKWSGIKDELGGCESLSGGSLSYQNDTGKTFSEIADIIEVNMDNL